VAVAAPAAVAAAWIPWRSTYPNLYVALALVLTVMAVGSAGSQSAALGASAAAAWWFDFFDAEPYGRPNIARGADLVTFFSLGAVGAVAGLVAARLVNHRQAELAGGRDLDRLRQAAGLVAMGQEPVEVIGAIAGDVSATMGAASCEFDSGDVLDHHPVEVDRDGTLCEPVTPGHGWLLSVPVWGQGAVMGRFLVEGEGELPDRSRLLLALALADQAGAFLAGIGAPPMAPVPGHGDELRPRLRLMGGPDAGPVGARRAPPRADLHNADVSELAV
jgi:hypothetical protein